MHCTAASVRQLVVEHMNLCCFTSNDDSKVGPTCGLDARSWETGPYALGQRSTWEGLLKEEGAAGRGRWWISWE